MTDWSIALPIITLVLGTGLAWLGGFFADGRQLRREQKARDAERATQLRERRDAFERDQVTLVYRALQQVGISASSYRSTPPPTIAEITGPHPVDRRGDAKRKLLEENGELAMATRLLLDSQVRALTETAHDAVADFAGVLNFGQLYEQTWDDVVSARTSAIDALASRLRDLYTA